MEAGALLQGIVHRLAQLLHRGQADAAAQRALLRLADGLLEDAAGDAEQEELDEPGHHGLAALALDDVHDLVVGRGMELHEDLPHHAHAGLGALAGQRQGVEVLHDTAHRAAEL